MEHRSKHKLVFLGNSFVGKTSIIEQYVNKSFDIKSTPTVGIDFLGKNITVDGKQVRLLLWDTAGQERFHSLIPSYLRDASCAIIVFDVTCKLSCHSTLGRRSFESLERWIKDTRLSRGNEALIAILANKIDCSERQVPEAESRAFAEKQDLLYYEVSAKTGYGIEKAMEDICIAMPSEPSFLITQSQRKS